MVVCSRQRGRDGLEVERDYRMWVGLPRELVDWEGRWELVLGNLSMKGMGLQRRERERGWRSWREARRGWSPQHKGGEHLERQEGFATACHTEGLASGSPGRKAWEGVGRESFLTDSILGCGKRLSSVLYLLIRFCQCLKWFLILSDSKNNACLL